MGRGNFDFEATLISLYSNGVLCDLQDGIGILRSCVKYSKDRGSEIDILTAADILKINYALINSDIEALNERELPVELSDHINSVWKILHDLYNPDRQYPLLLEFAIILYRLMTIQPCFKIDLWTLNILSAVVFPDELMLPYMSCQWMSLVNPRESLPDYTSTDAVLLILNIFKNAWSGSCRLYFALMEKEKEIRETVRCLLPKLHTDKILLTLTNHLYLNNSMFCEKVGVSTKTAINCLKELERSGILYSLRAGKEKIYFNKILCDFAHEQMQEAF